MKKKLLYLMTSLLIILMLNFVLYDGEMSNKLDKLIKDSIKAEISNTFDVEVVNTSSKKVLDLINQEDYQELLNFVSENSGSLNAYEMKSFLGGVINRKGEYEELVSISNSGMTKTGKQFVRSKIKAKYTNGLLNLEIIWDEDMEISGLNLK